MQIVLTARFNITIKLSITLDKCQSVTKIIKRTQTHTRTYLDIKREYRHTQTINISLLILSKRTEKKLWSSIIMHRKDKSIQATRVVVTWWYRVSVRFMNHPTSNLRD